MLSFLAALLSRLRQPAPDDLLIPERERRNRRALYWDIAWFGITTGIAINFLSVYAVRLNASEVEVGALTAAPALLSIFWLVPVGQIIARQRRLLPLILWSLFTHRLGYLLMGLLPWLAPREWVVPGLIALSALQAIPAGAANVAFPAMLPDAIAKERLGRVVGIRNALIGATSTLAVWGSGPILAALPTPLNYQVLFLIAFAASLVSTYAVSRLDLPERSVAATATGGTALADLREGMRRFGADRQFFWFTLSAVFLHVALFTPAPLFPIYWVRILGASDSFVSLIATLGGASSVLSALMMDRVQRRWGNRRVVGIAMLALAFYPILTALTHTLPPLLGISVMGGVFAAGLNICLFHALLQVAPDADRARFIAIYSMLVNVAIFAAPLFGSWLAGLIGVAPVLLLAGGLRLISGITFLRARDAY